MTRAAALVIALVPLGVRARTVTERAHTTRTARTACLGGLAVARFFLLRMTFAHAPWAVVLDVGAAAESSAPAERS